jgi:hypothetical protein
MVSKLPRPTYLFGLAAPVAGLTVWVGENVLQLQPWWPKLPWPLILTASFAFLVGLAVQDLYNPASWVRVWWREANRIFEVQRVVVATNLAEAGDVHKARLSWQAVRTVRRAKMVIRVYAGTGRAKQPGFFVAGERTYPELERGKQQIVDFATIPAPTKGAAAKGATWDDGAYGRGDYGVSPRALLGASRNVVAIEMRAGWRVQRYRAFLQMNSDTDAGRRVTVIGEDDDIFGIEPVAKARQRD